MKLQQVELALPGDAALRPLMPEDVTSEYVDGLNDPLVHQYLEAPKNEKQTASTVRQYVRANLESDDSLLLGLYVEGQLRGTIHVHDIDLRERSAWVGLAIFDPGQWGRGLGPEMLFAVVAWSREALGIRRMRAGVLRDNVRSARAFQKAGFTLDTNVSDDRRSVWITEAP